MKFKCFILLVIAIAAVKNIPAQSLRPGSIAAERISFWQHRGLLWKLSPLSQPHAVENALLTMQIRAFDEEYWDYLSRYPIKPWQLGLWVESENYYQDAAAHTGYLSRQRMSFHIPVTSWLSVTNTVYANNRLDEDPNYMGKRQNSLTGYTERAVISAHYKGFEAHLGRDHLVWGPGRDAALLISDHCRPMDQVRLGYRRSWFHYEFFTATLDPSRFSTKEGPARQRRYLSGHRLEIQPLKHLVFGISEAILFAEPDAGINLALFNPVIFYHGVQLNGPDTGNTVGSLNIAWMPTSYWTLYGDLMIDDIQLESSVPGDREPNAYGALVGTVFSDPFDISGAETTIEYTRVTNRTYNGQGGPWERWLHRREPLGHRMGNDFDRFLFGIEYWPVFS
ncbi:hypothetical protein GF406_16135, partial [candidate division KSB1 bacterium]|nr:hypothetical protein [candidate division KSB1 bacterium]